MGTWFQETDARLSACQNVETELCRLMKSAMMVTKRVSTVARQVAQLRGAFTNALIQQAVARNAATVTWWKSDASYQVCPKPELERKKQHCLSISLALLCSVVLSQVPRYFVLVALLHMRCKGIGRSVVI